MSSPGSSFSVRRVNKSTFLIIENDRFREHPYIYAKIHPSAPIIVLSDTGCDAPAEEVKHEKYVHLRSLLEEYPVPENDARPINPGGERSYLIIISHCHYDHIGGINQFLSGGQTQVVASAAGRDFIESDLPAHSLCNQVGVPVPSLHVTHWAQSHEHLTWPLAIDMPGDHPDMTRQEPVDLDITIFHTPGHTPCALTWYDHAEETIYVGDSFYQMGKDIMPILFPPQGDLIEWLLSMKKIEFYVYTKYDPGMLIDGDFDDWLNVKRVSLCAAHQTCGAEALAFAHRASMFLADVCDGRRKLLSSEDRFGEIFDYYMADLEGRPPTEGMSLLVPRRLVKAARAHFRGHARDLIGMHFPNGELTA